MNAKISLFVICVEVICLLYNLHDCTFKDLRGGIGQN